MLLSFVQSLLPPYLWGCNTLMESIAIPHEGGIHRKKQPFIFYRRNSGAQKQSRCERFNLPLVNQSVQITGGFKGKQRTKKILAKV